MRARASERASGERLDPVGKIRLGFLKNQSLATQSRFTQDSPGQSSWRLNSGFTKQSRKIRPGNCKREHTGVAEWRSGVGAAAPILGARRWEGPLPQWLPPSPCPSPPPRAHLTGCSSPQRVCCAFHQQRSSSSQVCQGPRNH